MDHPVRYVLVGMSASRVLCVQMLLSSAGLNAEHSRSQFHVRVWAPNRRRAAWAFQVWGLLLGTVAEANINASAPLASRAISYLGQSWTLLNSALACPDHEVSIRYRAAIQLYPAYCYY